MPTTLSPRIAVVDADRRVRTALAEVLKVAGVDVVGTAGDVRTALELVQDDHPDAIVVDPRLPDVEAGLALVSSVKLGWPALRVILMGWADNAEARVPDGAAYVAKSSAPEEFVAATLAACAC